MSFNSTIRQKVGECEVCGTKGPLQKKLCHTHYWLSVRMKSVNRLAAKEDQYDNDDVATLKKDLDQIFSQYVRLSAADEKGIAECFICGARARWQDMQNNHFVSRSNSFLRYDTRNCKCGCNNCNVIKGGNLVEFARKLEQDKPGITEILLEEGHTIYKFERYELKQWIGDYSAKVREMKSIIKV